MASCAHYGMEAFMPQITIVGLVVRFNQFERIW